MHKAPATKAQLPLTANLAKISFPVPRVTLSSLLIQSQMDLVLVIHFSTIIQFSQVLLKARVSNNLIIRIRGWVAVACSPPRIQPVPKATEEEVKRKSLQLKLRTQKLDCFSTWEEEMPPFNRTEAPHIFTNLKIHLQSLIGTFLFYLTFSRFKKLTVEERVNSLSTVYPHIIETFLNMH
jgi:hypothetical protein